MTCENCEGRVDWQASASAAEKVAEDLYTAGHTLVAAVLGYIGVQTCSESLRNYHIRLHADALLRVLDGVEEAVIFGYKLHPKVSPGSMETLFKDLASKEKTHVY